MMIRLNVRLGQLGAEECPMAKIVKEVIQAKGINIGIYTEDFQNEYI